MEDHLNNSNKRLVVLTLIICVSFLVVSCDKPKTTDKQPDLKIETSCLDQSEHKVSFITVEPGVQLEVLDWGGTGDYMIMLTGLGDNAHVFDHFAYQFTDLFHVIGITRRGFGKSSKPDTGYDLPRRALDYVKVMDGLGISSALFVGHSISGEELSELGINYPDRVKKLVYMDAADFGTQKTLKMPPSMDYTDADLSSIESFIAVSVRYLGVREPNAAVCNTVVLDTNGKITGAVSPEHVTKQIKESGQDMDYSKINCPALGIYAVFSLDQRLPYFSLLNAEEQQEYIRCWKPLVEWQQNFLTRWSGIKNSRMIKLPEANHYIFINNEEEVATEIRKFLTEK